MVMKAPDPVPSAVILAPTEAEWRALSPQARETLLAAINDALSDPAAAMSEGRRHKKAKTRTIDALGLHFSSIGRSIYLAEEMAVLYPGEPVFTPDVLAVLDVVEPEDDPRMAWVVADERRGLDLVIEVLHHGDRKKDLVDNVERYAGLGIPEYFVYDRLHERIHGYRLPDARARRYQRIVPQLGRHTSAVLGLDLVLLGGKLRFFYGQAELPGTVDLIGRLNKMVTELEAKADDAQAQLRHAEAQGALAAQRDMLTTILAARGIVCSDEDKARITASSDAAELQRWILRTMTATKAEEVFSG